MDVAPGYFKDSSACAVCLELAAFCLHRQAVTVRHQQGHSRQHSKREKPSHWFVADVVLATAATAVVPQVVEEGYEFFAKRQLVTIFSAPNYCGEFENAGAMMSVDETLMCSFQVRGQLMGVGDLHLPTICRREQDVSQLNAQPETRSRVPCAVV